MYPKAFSGGFPSARVCKCSLPLAWPRTSIDEPNLAGSAYVFIFSSDPSLPRVSNRSRDPSPCYIVLIPNISKEPSLTLGYEHRYAQRMDRCVTKPFVVETAAFV